jgi:hypothetical protein
MLQDVCENCTKFIRGRAGTQPRSNTIELNSPISANNEQNGTVCPYDWCHALRETCARAEDRLSIGSAGSLHHNLALSRFMKSTWKGADPGVSGRSLQCRSSRHKRRLEEVQEPEKQEVAAQATAGEK